MVGAEKAQCPVIEIRRLVLDERIPITRDG